ncbi:hypothetical protein Tco_1174964 [Tanacetum coccineum]
MTNTTHESTSQEKSYEQVIEDAHATLTSSQKTEGSKQSSSVSSDFASKFLNLDNVPPVIDEVASMMNAKTPHEELSTQAPPNLSVPMMAIPETSTIYPTIEENGVTRIKKYEELSATEKIQADCDLKATNIILQGLPIDVYSLVNHHRVCKIYGKSFNYLCKVNTKFLNSLSPEWSKFVTDVKLVRDLHTTNFDQLHAYLEQHELHAKMKFRIIDMTRLAVLVFKQGDDPIDAINKMMSFLSIVGDYQPVQGRQSSFAAGTSRTRANISGIVPKAKEEKGWSQFTQTVHYTQCSLSSNDLDEYILIVTDFSKAKAFYGHLSNYGSDVLSEYLLETQNAAVQDTNSFAQQDDMILSLFEQLSNLVTNCNKVNKDNLIANESLSAELESNKERVKLLEERQNVDLSTREKLIMDDIIREKNAQFTDFEKEINYLKQTLSEQSKEKESLTKTFNFFKNKSNKRAKNIDKEISLENKVKELDNIVLLLEHPKTDSALNDYVNYVEMCNKCLELEAELIKQHNMVEKDEYNRLLKSFSKLEQHCISLELAMQLNKEIFQKNNTSVNQTEPSLNQLFELKILKAELQAKHITIEKLKANIKRLNKTSTTNNVKKDIDEIETINI